MGNVCRHGLLGPVGPHWCSSSLGLDSQAIVCVVCLKVILVHY
jgi:hypothetical protein